jgi:hypothetical protein
VTQLVGVELTARFDPQIVQIIDAEPDQPGVQVKGEGAFSGGNIIQNEVNNQTGLIQFVARLLQGQVNGETSLFVVTWQAQNNGATELAFERVMLFNASGQTINHIPLNGFIEPSGCNPIP